MNLLHVLRKSLHVAEQVRGDGVRLVKVCVDLLQRVRDLLLGDLIVQRGVHDSLRGATTTGAI